MVPGRRCWRAVTIAPPSRPAEPAGLRATCVIGCYRRQGRTSCRARADPGVTGGTRRQPLRRARGGAGGARGRRAWSGRDRERGGGGKRGGLGGGPLIYNKKHKQIRR